MQGYSDFLGGLAAIVLPLISLFTLAAGQRILLPVDKGANKVIPWAVLLGLAKDSLRANEEFDNSTKVHRGAIPNCTSVLLIICRFPFLLYKGMPTLITNVAHPNRI